MEVGTKPVAVGYRLSSGNRGGVKSGDKVILHPPVNLADDSKGRSSRNRYKRRPARNVSRAALRCEALAS
jgi:hypothetical protein